MVFGVAVVQYGAGEGPHEFLTHVVNGVRPHDVYREVFWQVQLYFIKKIINFLAEFSKILLKFEQSTINVLINFLFHLVMKKNTTLLEIFLGRYSVLMIV